MLNRKGLAKQFPWAFASEAIFRKPFVKRLTAKGQESAPFELLVAVIIMGFVIFIGTSVMQQVNCEKCKGETNSKLDRMATALQNADESGRIQPNVSFFLSGCFNQDEEKIWIEDEDKQMVCAAYCGAEKQLCTLLKYYGNGCGGFSIIKCLQISPEADFPSISGGRCEDREGMQLVNFEDRDEPIATGGNKQGNYLLWNKTGQGDTYSTICAYRKED